MNISPLWITVALVTFVLGVRWTISQAASRAYAAAKAQVPVAKAAARGTFWAAARTAILILAVLLVLSWLDFGHNQNPASWLHKLIPAEVSDGQSPNGDKICFSAKCRQLNPERPRG